MGNAAGDILYPVETPLQLNTELRARDSIFGRVPLQKVRQNVPNLYDCSTIIPYCNTIPFVPINPTYDYSGH